MPNTLHKISDKMTKRLPLVIYIFFSFACIVVAFACVLNYAYVHISRAGIYFAGVLLVVLAVFIVGFLAANRRSPEKVFVIIAVPVCTAFATFLLIYMVPDEMWHVFKAFDLHVLSPDTAVPYSIAESTGATANKTSGISSYAELAAYFAAQPDWDNLYTVSRDLSTYLPQLYFLPYVAIRICCLLNVVPVAAVIVGRLVNACLFIVVGYFVIKKIPVGKTLACVYFLNPMLLQQEASLSADAFTNVAAFAFIAYVLWLRFEGTFNKKTVACLVVLLVLCSISKFIYFLFAYLLLIFVPNIKDAKKRKIIYASVAVVSVLGVLAVLTFYQSGSFLPTVELMRQPLACAKILALTIYENLPMYITQFLGGSLGALSISTWMPGYLLYGVLLLAACVFNLGERYSFKKGEKIFIGIFMVVLVCALILLFRDWSIRADGNYRTITGVQGRYFLPCAILPLLALINKDAIIKRPNCLLVYSLCMIVIYLLDFYVICRTFL